MGKPKIVGIGELLWDVLPAGRRLGGAPVNFAFYAQEQGAEACIVSAVGQDASGDELLGGIAALGLGVRAVQRNAHPTSTVEVTLDAAGVPAYRIREQVAWDYIERTAEADAAVERYEKESAGLGRWRSATPCRAARFLRSSTPRRSGVCGCSTSTCA